MVSDVARLEDDIAVMMRRFQADSEAVTLQMANLLLQRTCLLLSWRRLMHPG